MKVSRRFTFWSRVIRNWPFWWGWKWIDRRRNNEYDRVKKQRRKKDETDI